MILAFLEMCNSKGQCLLSVTVVSDVGRYVCVITWTKQNCTKSTRISRIIISLIIWKYIISVNLSAFIEATLIW